MNANVIFPVPMWNVYVRDQDPRTNNHVEAAINRGDPRPRRKRKWRDRQARITRLREQYDNGQRTLMSEEKRERLGWLAHPKAAKTKFSNTILSDFYKEFNIKDNTEKCAKVVSFVQSMNTAAAGRFLADSFKIKSENDSHIIKENREKLCKVKKNVSDMHSKLLAHNDDLFKRGTNQLRQGRGTMYAFNTEYMAKKDLEGNHSKHRRQT
uniref:Uncharacterized protein n=1 Tax=Branchiostoma floridae TaxID=7739 RepID=C4A061_BRAFL|eukprot:XP_002585818.1 hypothetical protein BRAFLDRAFT_111073 [Branchiostoma floridae]